MKSGNVVGARGYSRGQPCAHVRQESRCAYTRILMEQGILPRPSLGPFVPSNRWSRHDAMPAERSAMQNRDQATLSMTPARGVTWKAPPPWTIVSSQCLPTPIQSEKFAMLLCMQATQPLQSSGIPSKRASTPGKRAPADSPQTWLRLCWWWHVGRRHGRRWH